MAVRGQTHSPAANTTTNAPASREMHFRVVDADNGQPVPGVKVRSWAPEVVLTDDKGWCILPLPHPKSGKFSYHVNLSRDGYVGKMVTWSTALKDTIADLPAEYTVNMDRGVAVGGLVRNDQGQPLAGAHVIFSGPPDGISGQRERNIIGRDYHQEITDESGCWHNAEMPKNFQDFVFRVTYPDYVPALFGCAGTGGLSADSVLLPMADYLATNAVMVLGHGIELSGAVLDPAGKPVTGAVLTRDHEWRNTAAVFDTDTNGHFSIINLRPGDMILTVEAPGLAGQTIYLTLSNKIPALKIDLKPGRIFKGRVLDESGHPLAGASVQMDRLELGPLEYDWSTVTDDNGRFAWDSAPEGEHPYYFSAPNHHARSEPALVADGRDKVITLRAFSPGDKTFVNGTVTAVTNGAPIATAAIVLTEYTGGGGTNIQKIPVGKNGGYTATVATASAAYIVEVRADGYMAERSTGKYPGDGDVRLDFRMERQSAEEKPRGLTPGDTAPDFEVKTVDGQPLKLADFRGKFVLLDFWATWCGPCVGETPFLKATYEAYGHDDRFVMISLSLDDDPSLPKNFARRNEIHWIQGFAGPGWDSPVIKLYGVGGIPLIMLIGPDGKILEMDLRGDDIKAAVGRALIR